MPEETYQPVETKAGILWGRDAIFLSEVRYNGHELLLEGNINGSLASCALSRWMYYSIVFSGVLAFRSVELDSWIHLYHHDGADKSCFVEVVNSLWQAQLGGKVAPSHRHFFFATYDHVFDIVCEDFDMKIEASP